MAIYIYTTNPNKKIAEKIALHLLSKKLVACANIFPISSAYLWKGKIEKRQEHACILKSVEKNLSKIRKEIKQIHPYSIPCITKIKVQANSEFERWLAKEIK